MNDKDLKSLQTIELKILSVFDDFCKKHDIPYSLHGGTALGAIRHHGFIPWDDDVDTIMSRENLNKFISAWKADSIPGYYLETCLDDRYCGTCHVKLRKEDTILLSEGEDEHRGHHGIWIDIFPIDKVQKGTNVWNAYLRGILLVLSTRANVSLSTDTLKKRLSRNILRIIPYPLRKRIIRYSWKWFSDNAKKITDDYLWMSSSTIPTLFSFRLPQDMVDECVYVVFENKEFPIFKRYQEFLSIQFGDYMKLPPVSQRTCTHNPVKFIPSMTHSDNE